MRRGCVIVTVVLVMLIAIGGYLGYRYIRDSLALSQDLVVFDNRDSVLARVVAKAPPPAAGSKLTPERMNLYLGALDSVNVGWRALMAALDSVKSKADSGESIDSFKTWVGTSILREIVRLPLVSRRSLVNYLNLHGLSWEEYVWIKERTVAASMITKAEYDSAMGREVRSHLPSADSDSKKEITRGSADDLFRTVEQMRRSAMIDSTEIALVAPHRRKLLSSGLPSLVGLDTDLDNQIDVGFNEEE